MNCHMSLWAQNRLSCNTSFELSTVCTEQSRSPYIEHAASGLSKPFLLWEGVNSYPSGREDHYSQFSDSQFSWGKGTNYYLSGENQLCSSFSYNPE